MRIQCTWKEKLTFTAEADGHAIAMDTKTPLGSDSALTPKQLVLAGVCGCTAMDVVSLLRKHKQPLEGLDVEAEAPTTTGGHPTVFKEIQLKFRFRGSLDPKVVMESIHLSQTKFCGVSAMLSKAVPIRYVAELNGQTIGEGQADFR